MNIAALVSDTTDITFSYRGEDITATFLTDCLSPDFLQGLKDMEDTPVEIARVLGDALQSWNIDWDGESFPPTFENLRKLPFDFHTALANTIAETWTGKSQTPSESGNGLAVAAKPKTKTA